MAQPKKITLQEFTFSYWEAGNPNNELVILLHGFPEASIMWTGIMDRLADKGYYCIAPDMRGYSEGACPKGVKHYTIEQIFTDIFQMADAFKKDKFHLIGHDWGAIIGWHATHAHPERIISWTALSVPHPTAFAKAYKTDPVQKKKSKYIGLFLLPIVPEFLIRRKNFGWFQKLWKYNSPEVTEYYMSIFKRKASLTGALNYYRANLGKGKGRAIGEIKTPTLFIYGTKDLAIGNVATKGCEHYMTGDFTYLEVDGGHWLVQTNFDDLETAIKAHLAKNRS